MDVLRHAVVDAGAVNISAGNGILERKLYVEVNEALERIGGKWDKKQQRHVFATDPRPILQDLIDGGVAPARNGLAYFPTPPAIVDLMLRAIDTGAETAATKPWLDPSCGDGVLLDAARAFQSRHHWAAGVVGVEAEPSRAMAATGKGHMVFVGDFLALPPTPVYGVILMNPPFAVEGDGHAWIRHIAHAREHLAPASQLIAIAPASFLSSTHPAVAAWRKEASLVERLPGDAFKESGTSVNTILFKIWDT